MCFGISFLCLKYGVIPPDGLMVCYPALNLEDKFTPSLLGPLTDIIVPYPFLEICLNQYLKDERCDPTKDPLISPIKYTKEIIKQLPPLRIFVGEDDCLKDESIRFLENAVVAGHKDIQLVIYKMLRHGFLVFWYFYLFQCWDFPLGMPETVKCGEDTALSMRQMFDKAMVKKSQNFEI